MLKTLYKYEMVQTNSLKWVMMDIADDIAIEEVFQFNMIWKFVHIYQRLTDCGISVDFQLWVVTKLYPLSGLQKV